MQFRPIRTTGPAVALLSTAEAKAHCRVEHSDDDTMIDALVHAATDHLDGWSGIMGRCLVNQTWQQDFGLWGCELRLPFPDVSSVTITYEDENGDTQTLSSGHYELLQDAQGNLVRYLEDFTSPSLYDNTSVPVHVSLVAGYGAVASDVPQAIRQAALLLVGHWYENREAVATKAMPPVPMAVDALLRPYRRFGC